MDLNSDSKKKEGYRNTGFLGIPKDVMMILAGLFLCFIELIPGICVIVAGIISLLISIHFLKMSKDERKWKIIIYLSAFAGRFFCLQ